MRPDLSTSLPADLPDTTTLAERTTRALVAATLSFISLHALANVHGRVTLGDILLLAGIASFLTTVLASLHRDPAQFARALYERIRYAVVVPLCALLMLGLFCVRLLFLLFKLSLKLVVWLVVSVAYLLLPVDLIPDLFLGLGQLDDILLFISLGFWVLSSGIKAELRSRISIAHPTTPFP
jgi:uncharacterized membrane protein YkvA (DUF1232 family)